jgi:hypothetical protein
MILLNALDVRKQLPNLTSWKFMHGGYVGFVMTMCNG